MGKEKETKGLTIGKCLNSVKKETRKKRGERKKIKERNKRNKERRKKEEGKRTTKEQYARRRKLNHISDSGKDEDKRKGNHAKWRPVVHFLPS
jgi:hypothetical protein